MKNDWPAIITDLQRDRGISSNELARISGVSRTSLRRFKAGRGDWTIRTLDRVLEALSCELELFDIGVRGK
ncbi:Hypothetical protein NGAL_HAMBI490_28410 [Neorhizobium galegae bv. officinalis]|uniref:helix-turn-helix domain-containing protein n=1 Tax=Neorhizobium galegae TaxID=399 RepID=UPI000622AC95|nr:helix-turn-helix transcriptional regulator [Neorhizobium galegae]MCQ1796697.1 helix-turn-helix transcriptional regulator [Neorhizobium galegae]CDZ27988.1 Hypothetical protein NGAL_HAMBI490_28410 [Neorhizobium galegae bv. officinalis]